MFMGVTSHHHTRRVDSYETAVAAYELARLTPTGRSRTEKRYGFHLGANRNHGVTWVREYEPGGPIAFRLYETDVVTWHPDNSVHVENYGTVTTSEFAERFLPEGIYLHHRVERRGCSGGANTIGFRGPGERGWEQSGICQGSVVRFVEHGGRWVPDEDTCDPIRLPVSTDRKAARELARRYHLADFAKWLAVAPAHLDIAHECWDLDECLGFLEQRYFLQAAEFLPTIEEPTGFGAAERMKPLRFFNLPRNHHVTMGSLNKLKLAMWEDADLLVTEERRLWARRDYERGMARVREMSRLGLNTYGLGPD